MSQIIFVVLCGFVLTGFHLGVYNRTKIDCVGDDMLAAERKNLILERLEREGSVLVAPLSAEFEVSEETIRRDLEKLEREDYARRSYGGAVYTGGKADLPYSIRKKKNVAAKRRIAAKILPLISDGDFVMLDESSTSGFVAQAMKGKRNITLITNSIEIILELSDMTDWRILSTGGKLKRGVLALTGHQAESFIRGYHVDIAVISCTGIDLGSGCTDAGEDNALIKRAMMESADKTILAADAGKFNKKAFAPIGALPELTYLVTDAEPDEEWKTALEESGVELIF